MADVSVRLDAAAVFELLNAPDSPVTVLMTDLSERITAVARAAVRVRQVPTWSQRSDARPPGFTLASITENVHWDSLGMVYGGASAAEDPAVFLEDPADQYGHAYPFLTTGLWSLEGSV